MTASHALKLLVSARRWTRRVVLAVFLLLLACGNFTVARMWFFQVRSASYPVVEGVVLEHKKAPPEDAKPLVIEYAYEVNGERFTSNKYWYEAFGSTVSTDDTVAERFPVGARVAVSYNPADPADAVLIPGLQGADVLALWALVALHILMLAFAILFRGPTNSGIDYSAEGRIARTPFGWRLVPLIEPLWPLFWFSLLITMFVGICVKPGWAGSFPPLWEVITGTVAVVVAAVGLTVAMSRWVCPKARLEVDVTKRELRWRSGPGWSTTVALPFEVVTDVRAIELEHAPGKFVYWPQIVWLTPECRTRLLDLPAHADRDAVDRAVALVRDAVFGAAPSPQQPEPVAS